MTSEMTPEEAKASLGIATRILETVMQSQQGSSVDKESSKEDSNESMEEPGEVGEGMS